MTDVLIDHEANGLGVDDLDPFFVGWLDPPTAAERVEILRAASEVAIARTADGTVVGFATAITDGRFAAYIPLVEVLPSHQHRGIGSRLVATLLDRLAHCYMIDLVCDADVVPLYERLGGRRLDAVAWRNHERLHVAAGGTGRTPPDPGR